MCSVEMILSISDDAACNNVVVDIQWALIWRNQSCCCERNRRQFTLEGSMDSKRRHLEEEKTPTEALKKVDEMTK